MTTMTYTASQINRQAMGVAMTLAEANARIAEARKSTPATHKRLYRSRIIRKAGQYVWSWELK